MQVKKMRRMFLLTTSVSFCMPFCAHAQTDNESKDKRSLTPLFQAFEEAKRKVAEEALNPSNSLQDKTIVDAEKPDHNAEIIPGPHQLEESSIVPLIQAFEDAKRKVAEESPTPSAKTQEKTIVHAEKSEIPRTEQAQPLEEEKSIPILMQIYEKSKEEMRLEQASSPSQSQENATLNTTVSDPTQAIVQESESQDADVAQDQITAPVTTRENEQITTESKSGQIPTNHAPQKEKPALQKRGRPRAVKKTIVIAPEDAKPMALHQEERPMIPDETFKQE